MKTSAALGTVALSLCVFADSPNGTTQADGARIVGSRAANDGESRAGAPVALGRYPTSDEVFYVLSCMQTNGQDARGLARCSCAINALESRLPYERYTDAEMVITMRQMGGRGAAIFRDEPTMRRIVAEFVSAQTYANRKCFSALRSTLSPPEPKGKLR